MSQEEQAQLLERFRSGEIKVLVATSIAEEGLDIPSVDLVVFYEPVPSEIRYIQRKGRTGRRRFGRVVILAAEDTLDVSYLRASRRMAERMKRIVKSLNSELKPVLRLGTLQESPMPAELIAEAERRAPELPEAELEELAELNEELERERLREFSREVREVSKQLLTRVLRSGAEGISIAELSGEFEGNGAGPGALRAAMQKLRDEDQIRERGNRILPAGASTAARAPADVHTFEVERVLQGKAILFVDGKFRAVLIPDEYAGPRQLIRRGSRFRAAAKLYSLNGKLHARIYAVERAE
jgi:Fanconi anemia group M protein